MAEYKTPGVYIEEIPHLPPSIASVETAIPAFMGYTQIAKWKQDRDLIGKAWQIKSMLEYENYFGFPDPETGLKVAFTEGGKKANASIDEEKRSKFLMYYSLQMFFANGGGPCWIISVDDYKSTGGKIVRAQLSGALAEAARINEITLLLFPDAINLESREDYYGLYKEAIIQCADLQDRFVIMDVYHIKDNADKWDLDVKALRDTVASDDRLRYAGVYFPGIYTGLAYNYKKQDSTTIDSQADDNNNDDSVAIEGMGDAKTLADLRKGKNAEYFSAKTAITNLEMLLPPSSAMAGIYAQVDNNRGVWKAPANVNIENATRPEYLITKKDQETLNVDAQDGKSINVIRKFEGRGPAIVWGARTLTGNSNEWRYISVRRYFIMVEESVKNATQQFVFEPNDEHTWVRIKSMIANYLTQQWKAGALMGSSVKEAFFVHIGLGETMTELDVWEGRLIIEIGMAVVRPAEFIILRFMHKMLSES